MVKDDFSRFLREAARQEIVIPRHGRPAGVLIGFASEDDWFEYRLETDPVSFVGSNKRAQASARGAAFAWRMWVRSDGAGSQPSTGTTSFVPPVSAVTSDEATVERKERNGKKGKLPRQVAVPG